MCVCLSSFCYGYPVCSSGVYKGKPTRNIGIFLPRSFRDESRGHLNCEAAPSGRFVFMEASAWLTKTRVKADGCQNLHTRGSHARMFSTVLGTYGWFVTFSFNATAWMGSCVTSCGGMGGVPVKFIFFGQGFFLNQLCCPWRLESSWYWSLCVCESRGE